MGISDRSVEGFEVCANGIVAVVLVNLGADEHEKV